MNSAADCHEIPDCPGVFVDAFRGTYLSVKTKDPTNAFILSHYHGDHYGSLPRGQGSYQGPAKIHCTIVTAELLVHVHGVDKSLVVPHALGETWTIDVRQTDQGNEGVSSRQKAPAAMTTNKQQPCDHKQQPCDHHDDNNTNTNKINNTTIRITFYDANHCPGAAIILFHTPDGKVHLHTGDMRYHERMQTYPLLREAAMHKKIDTVLLDTTYAHPKHSFLPQEEAVDQIATQVVDLLLPTRTTTTTTTTAQEAEEGQQPANKTLILLSCYSIGKEKVLWEVAKRTGQPIYANERKRQMLACIQKATHNGGDQDDENVKSTTTATTTTTTTKQSDATCLEIINHCTNDPTASNIHIIPMGLAGRMWPFFQPNYQACLEYAQKQTLAGGVPESSSSPYKRVVAFLPTGWADASNWNKKNACKTIVMDGVTVSIRLVAYSEHSTHDELQRMVDFLQPRQVIPTVYSDDKDKLRIQARFRVDTKRAKEAFFKSMVVPTRAAKSSNHKPASPETNQLPKKSSSMHNPQHPSPDAKIDIVDLTCADERCQQETFYSCSQQEVASGDVVESLVSMGFNENDAKAALKATNGDMGTAIDHLLRRQQQQACTIKKVNKPEESLLTLPTRSRKHRREEEEESSPSKSGMKSIKSFFAVKKR